MKTEIAAICDAATDQGGKLNMLGVFDYIEANLPVVIPRCSIVFRIRYARSEIGKHQLRVTLENPFDHKEIFPPKETSVSFLPFSTDMDSAAVNLILNLNRFRVEKSGKYLLHLRIDEIVVDVTLPLYVRDLLPHEPDPKIS